MKEKNDNIIRIYPKEESKTELIAKRRNLKLQLLSTNLKICYAKVRIAIATAKAQYNRWRIAQIEKKKIRLKRKHEKRLARISRKYGRRE